VRWQHGSCKTRLGVLAVEDKEAPSAVSRSKPLAAPRKRHGAEALLYSPDPTRRWVWQSLEIDVCAHSRCPPGEPDLVLQEDLRSAGGLRSKQNQPGSGAFH
jgi:hypothetical protein